MWDNTWNFYFIETNIFCIPLAELGKIMKTCKLSIGDNTAT